MKTNILAVFSILILACNGLAQAKYETGSQEVGFTLGAAIPLTKTDLTALGGENEVAVKTGINVNGRYLYHASPDWAFGGEIGYAAFGEKEHDIDDSGAIIREDAKALTFEGMAKYTLTPEKKTRPYFIGGLGYGSLQQKAETRPIAGFSWTDTGTTEYRTNFDESIGALTLSLGAGLESFLTDSLALGLEARWRTIRTDKTVTDKITGGRWKIDDANSFVLTAGLSWKFGN
ncbi:MAG TPA: outer membrane beta-barrel protein [Elusimicrobiales bacterium]|nr:outer membrane beta-barrel protein [Elusimicrobiales bacterium]